GEARRDGRRLDEAGGEDAGEQRDERVARRLEQRLGEAPAHQLERVPHQLQADEEHEQHAAEGEELEGERGERLRAGSRRREHVGGSRGRAGRAYSSSPQVGERRIWSNGITTDEMMLERWLDTRPTIREATARTTARLGVTSSAEASSLR